MAFYTIRVELHGAGEPQYEVLHAAMEKKGFSRYIQADGGAWYKLPPAEYVCPPNGTIQTVLDAAKAAASQTGRTFAVFVSSATSWMSYGLQPVA